ncbi:MAG: 30S ribosomal protein S9 [bacterium]
MKEEVAKKPSPTSQQYFNGIGRRKTSTARVRLYVKGDNKFTINNKPADKYFDSEELVKIAYSPIEKMHCEGQFTVSVVVKGGGIRGQAGAIRHGISRALVLFNEAEFRKKLKKAGFLTRDSRMRERKKFGLKRARRAPQWQKR